MLAMDVVDTLRHRQGLVERELNAEDRRANLIKQLRQIYQSQGIEVSDAVLAQGVTALEDDRFSYAAPVASLSVKLAHIYVSRSRWLKGVLAIVGLVLTLALLKTFIFDLPQSRAAARLPSALDDTFAQIVEVSKSDAATLRARELLQSAEFSLTDEDVSSAEDKLAGMRVLLNILATSYDIRIVSRPNELSGVWRIPDANAGARNYYLIVEAIDRTGRPQTVEVINEEDGTVHLVDLWGLRVDEATFQTVSADKQDDGIIQNNRVGEKPRGYIEPKYSVATTGATITDW